MKPMVRNLFFCLALFLLAPFTAFAADATDTAPSDQATVTAEEVASTAVTSTAVTSTAVTSTPAPTANPASAWTEEPEWTTGETPTSFGLCQGPPVLSCQCGPSFQFPRAEPCCHCDDTCWDGYVLALCGGLGSGE